MPEHDHTRLTPRAFASFSVTMFAVGMISVGFGAVDMALVAPFGVQALAAVGLAEVVVVTVTAFLGGPIDAYTSRLAQAEGAGVVHREIARLTVAFALVVVLLQLLAVGIALVSADLLEALGQDPVIAAQAADYVQVRLGAAAVTIAFMVAMEVLRIFGRRRLSVVVLTFALLGNVVLDLAVLHGPPSSVVGPVVGVAATTVLVHAVAALVAAVAVVGLVRRRYGDDVVAARPAEVRGWFRTLLPQGAGIGVRHLNDYAASTVPFLFIGTLGVQATAAAAVATKIWTLYCRVPQACIGASFVFYGYAVGRDESRAPLRRTLLRLTAVPTVVAAALVLLAAPWLVDVVGGGSVDRSAAVLLVVAFLLTVVPYLFEKLAGELLTVEGHAGFLATASTLVTYLLSLPLAAVGVFVLDSAFLALASTFVGSSLLAVLFWRRLTTRTEAGTAAHVQEMTR